MKNIKTHADVITSITAIIKLMRKANEIGVCGTSYYIDNINIIEFFKAYESLKATSNEVVLYTPGENFNDSVYELKIRPADGFVIYIQSEKVSKVKPKINLINYN